MDLLQTDSTIEVNYIQLCDIINMANGICSWDWNRHQLFLEPILDIPKNTHTII